MESFNVGGQPIKQIDEGVIDNSNLELLNNLGNFINRALSFCFKTFKGEVQGETSLEQTERRFLQTDTELPLL